MDGRNNPSLLLVALLFLTWLHHVVAMRPDRMAELRQQTVDMFYHGYNNYMHLAFPEDEVCLLPATCPHLLCATQDADNFTAFANSSCGPSRAPP